MGAPAGLKRWLAPHARQHPAVAISVAACVRRLGRAALASHVEHLADLVQVVPERPATPFHLSACDGRDQVVEAVAGGGWGAFEEPLPSVLVQLIACCCPRGIVTDVGANTGYYALLAASAAPGARVDAFEPYPPALRILRRNIAVNRADRVRVHEVALGAEAGRATLYVPEAEGWFVETSSSFNPAFGSGDLSEGLSVEMTTLDQCYPAHVEAPALLKIDVESLEPEVLEGGARLLEATQPLVVLELLPHEDPARLEALRQRHDYVDIRLRPTVAVIGGPVVPDPEAWNHLWCPPAQLRAVRDVLTAVGLELVKA